MIIKYKLILVKVNEGESEEKLMMRNFDREDRLFEGEITPDEMVEIMSHAFDLAKRRK